jgi:NAD(P)-dependent dehydrogenase (short-subunit alcohol dehydrogenase family)
MSSTATTSTSAGDTNRDRLIVILGSGPGIGVGVASHFAGQTFGRVALISRNAERLEDDARTVRETAGRAADQELKVKVYAVDVADVLALEKTLRQVDQELGPPEVVLYNAARLRQTKFGEVAVKGLVEDFQVSIWIPVAAWGCFSLSWWSRWWRSCVVFRPWST